MMKRSFDVVLSVLALVVLAPVLLVIAVLVRLSSEGPVIFRQLRVGRFGKEFEILKFRTMYVDRDGPSIAVAGDSRVTRVGVYLRKYRLDELPQLFNVLDGDMSFVGPRPEVPEYMARYPEDARRRVLSMRPGVTDLAAIEFRDEATLLGAADDPNRCYVEQILPRKIELQLEYADRSSMVFDLEILWRTLSAIFGSAPNHPRS